MIHKSAIIHPTAKIAEGVEIGPFAIIGENTILGKGTKVGAHAVVEYAEIAENCTVFSHAAIGGMPQDLKYKGEPTKIIIGPNCSIREFTTLNRGTVASGKTVIGANCLLMAYTHVAHDCRIGNNVIFANAATLGGHVEVGDGAVIGGIVAIHQFSRIGRLAMLAGGAMVSQDVIPFTQVHGNRARLTGLNLVGLRRNPVLKEALEDIKSAYRVLFLSGIPLQEAIDQIAASNPRPEVKEMIDFISNSKRGFCRPTRKENSEEEV